MDLLTDDSQGADESLPRRVDVRRLRQERKRPLKYRRLRLRVHGGQSQAVHRLGAGGQVAELNEVLWSDVQHLTAPVQLQDGPGGGRVERVRRVCQPGQDAGIDQMGHYSYS